MILKLRSAIISLKDAVINKKPLNIISNNVNVVGKSCLILLGKYGKNGPVARELNRILDDLRHVWADTLKCMGAGKNKISRSVIKNIDDMEEAINEIGGILKLEFKETES
jgi:hypothetical protein